MQKREPNENCNLRAPSKVEEALWKEGETCEEGECNAGARRTPVRKSGREKQKIKKKDGMKLEETGMVKTKPHGGLAAGSTRSQKGSPSL